jgi:hypothetical protein
MPSILTSDINVDTIVNGFQTIRETSRRRSSVAEQRPGFHESEQRQRIARELGFRVVQRPVSIMSTRKVSINHQRITHSLSSSTFVVAFGPELSGVLMVEAHCENG